MVVEDVKCKWCKVEEEDINHALLYCSSFKEVLEVHLSFLQDFQAHLDVLQILAHLVRRNKQGEIEKLFLCAWGLWYRRNQFLYEEKNLKPAEVLDNALSGYSEYQSALENQQQGCKPHCGWQLPPTGVMKLNTDGAIFHDFCRSGAGMVL
ncbi:uncharacterized protein LOC121240823 [Juglans microcarpa x Juglans regia]|uniref:uncharacterized protein LOC121240823 n=1 Tax=Juglans microcarpa x Juglans regia TaxID=2249226 RepID=UPI001B7EC114|nr:uncharacterized protein LOC121240823 [Juglans microcarpa x Juglans regia]